MTATAARSVSGPRSGAAAPVAPRSHLRAVALPSEHGGWGLSAEPVLLGLVVAPSWTGLLLGVATVVAFLARTPLRVVLVDHHRDRDLDRTRVARAVLAVEGTILVVLVGAAFVVTSHPFWWPLVVAAPLVVLELWFDMRSRSRRLVPELAGSIGVCAAAAAIVLAGGESATLALGVWLVLAARSVTAIPHVRDLIARMRQRPSSAASVVAGDVVAVGAAGAAVALDRAFLPGALAVVALVAAQWAIAGRGLPVKVVGIGQSVFGLAIVVATAAGVLLA